MTLPFHVGRWRGTGWTVTAGGRVEFEQQEIVRCPFPGELITIEGRANQPGDPDDVRFRGFAVATLDPSTGDTRLRAYSGGHVVEVPLTLDGEAYRWEFEAAPGVLMRYDGTAAPDRWRETGHRSTDGGATWTCTFDMELSPA